MPFPNNFTPSQGDVDNMNPDKPKSKGKGMKKKKISMKKKTNPFPMISNSKFDGKDESDSEYA